MIITNANPNRSNLILSHNINNVNHNYGLIGEKNTLSSLYSEMSLIGVAKPESAA